MNLDAILKPGAIAVITGAAGGIGLAAAELCARRGMKVALADLPSQPSIAPARPSPSSPPVPAMSSRSPPTSPTSTRSSASRPKRRRFSAHPQPC